MAGIGIAAAIGFVFILSSISNSVPIDEVIRTGTPTDQPGSTVLTIASTQKLSKFSSIDELKAFLLNTESVRNALSATSGGSEVFNAIQQRIPESTDSAGSQLAQSTAPSAQPSPEAKDAAPGAAGSSYSTTNVQVASVDEPDFIKNDGKYAYVLSGDKLTIAEVYPAESARVIAKVGLDIQQGQQLQNMFLRNNTLVVFYQEYSEEYVIPQYEFAPQPVYAPKTHAIVMDITDKASPKVTDNYTVTGTYSNARLIGDYVYLVTSSDLYNYYQPLIPKIAGPVTIVPDIYYFDNPEPYYSFNTVTSINIIGGGGAVNSKTFMMNPASTLYVSENNIYIAYQKYQPYGFYENESRDRFFGVVVPQLSGDAQMRIRTIDADDSLAQAQKWDSISSALQDMYNLMNEQDKAALVEKIQKALGEYDASLQRDSMRTVVHKIAIGQAGELDYVAKGEVPGRLLNQFSMDEREGKFRLATTVEYYSPYSQGLYSNVYVLNGQMETVGKLEQIEPGESIYAARFIGERLYLVTFQRIDPLFVIDLSNDQPRILGELKLPGYSSYLHPYDANHIIGIGKDAKENDFGGVQATGVKVALFDVSDVSKPRLVDDHIIEGQGTDSEAVNDHKAFFFDRSRGLLSLPVSRYDAEPKYEPDGSYIPPKTWRGFYVFNLNAGDGISLKGTVEHGNAADYNYYGQGGRSFFIGDVLYTLSANNLIKMNDIGTLQEMNELDIGGTGGIIYPIPLDDTR